MLKVFSLLLIWICLGSSLVDGSEIFNDVTRLNPLQVDQIVQVYSVDDIRFALKEAGEKDCKVSIAGQRHSQGGQQACQDCIVLDMREFNEIVSIDLEGKIVRVQSGATWEDIQKYVQPYGLSMTVMQASNIFTVGGALGSNIHGNDPHYGTIIETVRSFRLMKADGSIVPVSREENPELFHLAIGGYGLFGVILDVDLQLTEDVIYEMRSEVMDYKQYPDYFKKAVLDREEIGLHSAKLSHAPESLLEEVVSTSYFKLEDMHDNGLLELEPETDILRNKFF